MSHMRNKSDNVVLQRKHYIALKSARKQKQKTFFSLSQLLNKYKVMNIVNFLQVVSLCKLLENGS